MADDASLVLARLESSPLFAGSLRERRRYDHVTFAALSTVEARASMQAGIDAAAAVPSWHALAADVRMLGTARHAAAVPRLRRLWETCPIQPIRVAAGQALRTIDSPESRAALRASIDDSDHLSLNLGVRATFADDAPGAFDALGPYFESDRVASRGGAAVARGALEFFCPTSFTRDGAKWTEPNAPRYLRDDPRWFDRCVTLRTHEILGSVARRVLRHADKAAVDAALAGARAREVSREPSRATRARGDLLARYVEGDGPAREAVWSELRAFGALGGDLRDEANVVARAMMAIVRRNILVVQKRLHEAKWRSLSGSLMMNPSRDDAATLADAERRTGAPLPPSLRAFWEVVGGVDFAWDYHQKGAAPDLGTGVDLAAMDPLSVDGPSQILEAIEEAEDEHRGHDPEICDPFSLSLSPDYLHKANISGGGPYAVEVPFLGADPIFGNEEVAAPFVDYLRDTLLRWAGFARLAELGDDAHVRRFVEEITSQLEPF